MKGVHLSLRMGSVVTVAAPRAVIEALTEVQVQSESGSQSGFQLQFTLGKDGPLNVHCWRACSIRPYA